MLANGHRILGPIALLAALASPAAAGERSVTAMRWVFEADSLRHVLRREVRELQLEQFAARSAAAALRAAAAEADRALALAAGEAAAPAAPGVAPAPPAPGAAPTPPTVRVRAPRAPVAPRLIRMARRARPPLDPVTIDTVLVATPGTVLEVESILGDVRVTGLPRNGVRLRFQRDPRDRVLIERRPGVLALSGVSGQGPAEVDWTLEVPRWMPVQVSAVEGDVRVTGTSASVSAESVRGDVHVTGGSGSLDVSSIEGQVFVEGARGTVRAGSVNNELKLLRVIGTIDAQTVNGDIDLSDLDAARVDASTVNGSVWFGGSFQENGEYRFTSHNGELVLGVPDDASLDLSVHSFNGAFRSGLRAPTPPVAKGKRFEFQLGRGGALVDLESFNGLIRLVRSRELERLRPAPAPEPAPREKPKDKPKEDDR